MSTTTPRQPKIAIIDDSAAAPASVGGADLGEFIDEYSLAAEIKKAADRNRAVTRPFRQYQKLVIERAEVPNTHQTRQMTSHICGLAARLPFVPDDVEKIDGDKTEYDQQVIKTAEIAERQLDSEMVWTASAQKLSRAALDLRRQDPDGKRGIAWVNDTRESESHVLDD